MVEATAETITLRKPTVEDGAKVWQLIRDSEPLEPNTSYAYLLLCHHFADTCVVAECDGELAGCVMAYRPPTAPDRVFVWQVAVDAKMRGRGVGLGLLSELVERDDSGDLRFLEATVSPSNRASRALFETFARKQNAPCVVMPFFQPRMFAEEGHEKEALFRIKLNRSSRES